MELQLWEVECIAVAAVVGRIVEVVAIVGIFEVAVEVADDTTVGVASVDMACLGIVEMASVVKPVADYPAVGVLVRVELPNISNLMPQPGYSA